MDHEAGLTPKKNVPLAPMTTLKIGGPARYFVRAVSEGEVVQAFELALENSLKVFILGGGSNVLVSDKGFDGLVLQIALRGISHDGVDNKVLITARAGEDWDAFVAKCVAENLAGLECLSGIPGSVGGTPVQNVGAYGQEVSETIISVRCYDRWAGEVVELTNAECGFAYRTSIFNTIQRERYIVLAVTYELTGGGEPKIVYKDLREYFRTQKKTEGPGKADVEAEADHPTLQETRDAILEIRRAKSMVIDEGDPNSCSAGSFFKNPIVALAKYSEIAALVEKDVPKFAVDSEQVKIPAAWLIENAGFHKGFSLGNAGISTKHTLALINRGGATATEILELKDLIQQEVDAKFGIRLVPEPVFVGFSER